MTLALDARQRAMLAEMGVRVWQPEESTVGARDEVNAVATASDLAARGAAHAPQARAATTVGSRAQTPESIAQGPDRAPTQGQFDPQPAALTPRTPAATRPTTSSPATPRAAPIARAPRPEGIEQMDWPALEGAVAGCGACVLCESRRNTVFGVGSRQADWMVIGEAPGENEDRQGEPFVGQAGKLLDNMLAAIALSRHAALAPDLEAEGQHGVPTRGRKDSMKGVFIANVLKCRPPGNRNPQPEEVAQCEPYLRRQVELVRPRIILAMGRFAVQSILQTTEPIGRLRGRVHQYAGVPVVVTYHPAYLLRNLPDKARAWEDLCLAMETFERGKESASAT